MTETFKISLYTNTTYQILNQPSRNFSCRIGDIFIASSSFPASDRDVIYLQGSDKSRDNILVTLYSGHLKVLEELCRRQHWRFIICMS